MNHDFVEIFSIVVIETTRGEQLSQDFAEVFSIDVIETTLTLACGLLFCVLLYNPAQCSPLEMDPGIEDPLLFRLY